MPFGVPVNTLDMPFRAIAGGRCWRADRLLCKKSHVYARTGVIASVVGLGRSISVEAVVVRVSVAITAAAGVCGFAVSIMAAAVRGTRPVIGRPI